MTARRRLRDGDVIAVGGTSIAFCAPRRARPRWRRSTSVGPHVAELLTPAQRRVLIALCRPFKDSTYSTPATNQQIADELVVSVDAVKSNLRALFSAFGVDDLPQNQKRASLALQALRTGVGQPSRPVTRAIRARRSGERHPDRVAVDRDRRTGSAAPGSRPRPAAAARRRSASACSPCGWRPRRAVADHDARRARGRSGTSRRAAAVEADARELSASVSVTHRKPAPTARSVARVGLELDADAGRRSRRVDAR